MKIAFLINDLSSGGAERATVSLADCLSKENEVEIITFKGTESFYPISDRVKIVSINLPEIEHSASIKRLLSSLNRMMALRKFVKSRHLDVLIGMSFSMTYYTVFSTVFTSAKSIGTERNNPYIYKATKLNTFLRKFFSRHTDGYIFQTKRSAEFFSNKAQKNGIIIPNAIFNQNIYSITPPQVREKIICGIGRLSKQKRFDLLIDAFDKIKDEFNDYSLVIFGDGELKDELSDYINELGLSERITLAGAIPDAYKYVSKASVFVLCSDFEGMPNALMETMAMGVPCISTRCDMGPEELITDGENGLLVDTDSSSQIANSLTEILNDASLSSKLSENGRKMLITHSIDSIGKQWSDYINKVIS